MKDKFIIILSAVFGGLFLNYLKIPAGALIGSIAGTAVAQVFTNTNLNIPSAIRKSIRVIMGCYIGLGITYDGILRLKDVATALIIVLFGITCITIITAFTLHKIFNFSLKEAFLSSLPAGLSEVGMNAEDFGADPMVLTTIHVMRLTTIVTLIPIILQLFKV